MRSPSNYRLYTEGHVQYLRRIVALKQQGFQLEHIRQLLETEPEELATEKPLLQLQQQYRLVLQQMTRLRQTASALEGLLGRDRHCQTVQAEVIAQLRHLEVETADGLETIEKLWDSCDAAIDDHPESFTESLQQLLPDLSERSEIEVDLLSKLALASGDVSLVTLCSWEKERSLQLAILSRLAVKQLEMFRQLSVPSIRLAWHTSIAQSKL